MASFTASFKVRLPEVTGRTSAPSSSMRKTLSSWRLVSTSPMNTVHSRPNSAAAVADATPCCPAPVSAMMRRLAHAPGEQRLADHVVDLVRAGVRQVLALEEHPHAQPLGEPRALGDRRGAPAVVGQQVVELLVEGGIGPGLLEGLLEIEAGRHQGLGDEPSAEVTEAPVGTGLAHQTRHYASRQS